MKNLCKRRYKNKKGCGCAMCKPHKHHHADRRKLSDVKADLGFAEQMD